MLLTFATEVTSTAVSVSASLASEADAEFDTQTDRRSSIVRDNMSSIHLICCLVFIISFVVFFTNAAPLGKCNCA